MSILSQKTTTMRITLFAASFLLLLGCEHKTDSAEKQDFSCVKIFDDNGLGLGLHGPCTTSNDWGNIALTASEQAFLNFNDTISLAGTLPTTILYFSIFPCPVVLDGAIQIAFARENPDHPVKLKIAIVDESLQLIKQSAVRIEASGLALHMDPAKFQAGKYYRMYYRISAEGAPSLFEGYGNFVVCKTHINGVTTTIEADCM